MQISCKLQPLVCIYENTQLNAEFMQENFFLEKNVENDANIPRE